MQISSNGKTTRRFNRPPWLKVRMRLGDEFHEVDTILKSLHLNTVCREAACPNIGTCFNERTATFLILGHVCSRNCLFCNVRHGSPLPVDASEPERIAQAVKKMGLEHVVITSVTRDDLPDGGASAFADTVAAVRAAAPLVSVEVLIPDLQGERESLRTVVDAKPDVIGHNVETVPRLYAEVRSSADYGRSLSVLKAANELSGAVTKSSVMIGLGESRSEVGAVLNDLASCSCDVVTIGQYLAPTAKNISVKQYYTPQDFEAFSQEGLERGIRWMESGPLVRSSFHAKRQWHSLLQKACGS